MVKSLSVFFPAYNEEGNLKSVVSKAVRILRKYKFSWEIIIVDDGSTDKTGKIADQLARDSALIKVVHQENGGYGQALRTGFASARYEWVVYTDADDQFDFSEIDKFLEFTEETDAVWGYRLERKDSITRFITGLVWVWSVRLLFWLPLSDVNCGFKMIKKKVFQSIEPLLSTRGAMINAEMAIKIKQRGYKIAQIGVSHFPRISGSPTGVSLPVIAQSYLELIKFRSPYFLPIIVIFFASFLLPFVYWPEMLNWPFWISQGLLPYRDIAIVHTPLLLYVLTVFYKFLGFSPFTLHIFGSLLLTATTYLVAKISQSVLAGFLFAFLAFSFNGNHVWFESLLAPLLLAVYLFQRRFVVERKNWLLFMSGIFLLLAILTKQTTLYVFPAMIPFFLKLRRLPKLIFLPVIFISLLLLWPGFYYWAIRFVFLKPFINDSANAFMLLPNIRQTLLLIGLFSTALIPLLKDRKFEVASTFLWMVFSLLFAFPRFDYFHLIPSLAFLTILIGKNKKLVLVSVIIGVVIFWKNFTYTHTFLEPEIIKIADTVSKNYSQKTLLVVNGPDQLYFLTRKLPADLPWLPQLPWYLAYYSDNQFLADIKKASADIIIAGPYLDSPVDGLGAYRPTGVENFLMTNYTIRETFDNGIKLLEKL